MTSLFSKYRLAFVLSALLCFAAIVKLDFLATWICYVPLFIEIMNKKPKEVFKTGFFFGLLFSIPSFYWMIPGAKRFTGNSIFYGIVVFLLSALLMALFCAILLYIFALLKHSPKKKITPFFNTVLMASVFTVGEWGLSTLTTGFPWFQFHSGAGLVDNVYSIQAASLFGLHILTFIGVAVNFLFAWCFSTGQWKRIVIPFSVIGLYMLFGFILLTDFEKVSNNRPFVKVAILAENIPSETKWNDNTGNFLVQKILGLARSAAVAKPDLALWSESAIPWTYKKDDDLVKEILAITKPSEITHILGINTESKSGVVLNSAYALLPDGNASGRYDKQFLLTFIEKPIKGWIIPFFSSNGYSVEKDVRHADPLSTPYGNAGILICNEVTVPAAAASLANKGAEFLLNMSNNGWFNDTYLVRSHFFYARLCAVQARKDLVINCSNGYSGLIKASGEIKQQESSDKSFISMVSLQPNNAKTTSSSYPDLFIYFCAALLLGFIVCKFSFKKFG